jgi:hypothetical protein
MKADFENVEAWPDALADFASKAVVMDSDGYDGKTISGALTMPAWPRSASGSPPAVQVGRPRQPAPPPPRQFPIKPCHDH